MAARVGFCCKYMHSDQTQKKKLLEEIQRPLNTKSTTVQWLNRQTRDVAEQRLWDIMEHNIQAFYNLITYVGDLSNDLRMVRLGSDCLPVYTHPEYSIFGNYLMWSSIANSISTGVAPSPKNVMFASVCILASLLFLLVTGQTL